MSSIQWSSALTMAARSIEEYTLSASDYTGCIGKISLVLFTFFLGFADSNCSISLTGLRVMMPRGDLTVTFVSFMVGFGVLVMAFVNHRKNTNLPKIIVRLILVFKDTD